MEERFFVDLLSKALDEHVEILSLHLLSFTPDQARRIRVFLASQPHITKLNASYCRSFSMAHFREMFTPDSLANITDLNLSGMEIDDAKIAILLAAIGTGKKLRKLDLSQNKLTPAAMSALLAFLEANPGVEEINLSGNKNIGESASLIATSLRAGRLPALRALNLSNCGLQERQGIDFAEALRGNRTLKSLNLSCNNLGDRAAAAFGIAFAHHDNELEELGLAFTKMTVHGLGPIAVALAGNRFLRILDLQSNPELKDARAEILHLVQKAPELRKLLIHEDISFADELAAAVAGKRIMAFWHDNHRAKYPQVYAITDPILVENIAMRLLTGEGKFPTLHFAESNALRVKQNMEHFAGLVAASAERLHINIARLMENNFLDFAPLSTLAPEATGALGAMAQKIKELVEEKHARDLEIARSRSTVRVDAAAIPAAVEPPAPPRGRARADSGVLPDPAPDPVSAAAGTGIRGGAGAGAEAADTTHEAPTIPATVILRRTETHENLDVAAEAAPVALPAAAQVAPEVARNRWQIFLETITCRGTGR